jgi:DNA-binding NarL/FixJ family response regulator
VSGETGRSQEDQSDKDPENGRPTKVFLIDSRWITRTALHSALASVSDIEIAAMVVDCDEAVETITTTDLVPDVLVFTDANDPAAMLPRLSDVLPHHALRVLMIGGEDFPASLDGCATAGWLPQSATEQQFVAAVRLIAAGHWVVPRLAHVVDINSIVPLAASYSLTAREREVLRLVAHGYTNAEISMLLRLGQSTVKSHVQNLLGKIGVRNRVRAAIYAYQIGLLRPQVPRAPSRAG